MSRGVDDRYVRVIASEAKQSRQARSIQDWMPLCIAGG